MDLTPYNQVATGAAAGITLLAVISKLLLSRKTIRQFSSGAQSRRFAPESLADPLEPAKERIRDVEAALNRHESIATTNRWINGLLTTGQYIIGGLLASSFIQESLSRQLVGGLGVLVILSSLIYQRFRPDTLYKVASLQALRLRKLLREAEDDFVSMQSNAPGAPTVTEFRRKLSSAMDAIEAAEFENPGPARPPLPPPGQSPPQLPGGPSAPQG